MNNDDDDLRFRDNCAIQIMQALLARGDSTANTAVNQFIENNYPDSAPQWKQSAEERIEHYAMLSYKIADIMRKARLASFK